MTNRVRIPIIAVVASLVVALTVLVAGPATAAGPVAAQALTGESAPGLSVPTWAAPRPAGPSPTTDPGGQRAGVDRTGPTPGALIGERAAGADETVGTGAVSATFQVNWNPGTSQLGTACAAWDPAAQSAFQAALNTWGSKLSSVVPIKVDACWTDFGAGNGTLLGYAGPTRVNKNFAGNPYPNTWFPDAIANAIAGIDVAPSFPEITAAFNSAVTIPQLCGPTNCWHTGSGNPSNTQYDFQSVVLHEIGHGLGFLGTLQVNGNDGVTCCPSSFPFPYDLFAERGNGTTLLSRPIPSGQLKTDLTSNDVFFDGPWAKLANGGVRPRLYAPSTYAPGSTYSHLDESTYGAASGNALMTPTLFNGETERTPGPMIVAMMRDLGWPLTAGAPDAPTSVVATAGVTSAQLTWVAPAGDGGSPVTGYTVTLLPSNATIEVGNVTTTTLTNLPPGVPVSFTVSARNAIGTGPPSAASNQVIPTGSAPTGAGFHPVTPFRILDSRSAIGFNGSIGPDSSRSFPVGSIGGIPADASAVVLNLTVTEPSAGSFATLYPTGATRPTTANLLFGPGQTVPNLVTVAIGVNGRVSVYNQLGTVHVIGDVVGWYDDGTPVGDRFVGTAPVRALDSRNGTGGWPGSLGPGQTRDLVVAGTNGVPADATAVVMNVTATQPTKASFLRLSPTGTGGTTANLLFGPGQTVPNLVTVGIDPATASVAFFNQLGSVHVVADIVGYYRPTTGSLFHALTPVRILDSRDGTGGFASPWNPGAVRAIPVAGEATVPLTATAIALNVTVTAGSTQSFLTAFPDGDPNPGTANLLWGPGQTVPNAVIAQLGDEIADPGRLALFNQLGTVHVIADANGYFE